MHFSLPVGGKSYFKLGSINLFLQGSNRAFSMEDKPAWEVGVGLAEGLAPRSTPPQVLA